MPFRVTVVEVGHRLGCAHVGVTGAALEAPFLPLALFDGEDVAEPGLVDDLVAAGDQSEQAEGFTCL